MARTKSLGDFGKTVTKEILITLKYSNIEVMASNTWLFDLRARLDDQVHMYKVKTRNKWRFNGDLKVDDYNLYADKGKEEAVISNLGAQIESLMWVAVTVCVKTQTYSIYIGKVNELQTMKYIPMKPQDITGHKLAGRCVVYDKYDSRISPAWTNIRGRL